MRRMFGAPINRSSFEKLAYGGGYGQRSHKALSSNSKVSLQAV
jgi:hypothetical protein